jgi:hypothetical protein
MKEENRDDEIPTYQGSRFPWWLALYWVGFLVMGTLYLYFHFVPDLRSWLSR